MLNNLSFVKWDRFVNNLVTDQSLSIYGWIDREDSKKDFVHLTYYTSKHPLYIGFGFTTSSSKYSKEISKIINHGLDLGKHTKCQRVETYFPKVINVIHLKK